MEQEYINEIHSIREWSPTNLYPIPDNVDIFCIDVCEHFIALGSSSKVFWFNRKTNYLQSFQLDDSSSQSTVIKISSSVEFMIAVGTNNGMVNIFQIPKEIPAEFRNIYNKRPTKRFIVRDLHQATLTSIAWNCNAMQLFSGDSSGKVVLTTLDYSSELIKSQEILNESYEIVQISVKKADVLISTIFRTVLCSKHGDTLEWTIVQIGSKDRRNFGHFGSQFLNKTDIVCSRPGLKLWLTDLSGNVKNTLLFKEAFRLKSCWEIPLLNPSRFTPNTISDFGIIKLYLDDYIVVWSLNSVYVLSLKNLQIEAVANGFRNISDIAIAGKEIFVLENCRSLTRLSPAPDNCSYSPSIMIFNNLILEEVGIDSDVAKAEEAVEHASLNTIDISPDNIDQKLEAFDKIGNTDFESCIRHTMKKGGKHKAKKCDLNITGIVEIGRTALENVSQSQTNNVIEDVKQVEENASSKNVISPDVCVEGSNQSNLHIWNYLFDKENVEIQTTPRRKLHFIKETLEPESPECRVDLPNTLKLPFELQLFEKPKSSESTTSSEWEFVDN